MARKCARIFVRGHYLFLEAHSFPLSSLSKTVQTLLGTDHVRGQISAQIFSRQMEAIVFISLIVYLACILSGNKCSATAHTLD